MKKLILFYAITACISAVLALSSGEAILRIWTPPWLKYRMLTLDPPESGAVFGTDRAWKIETKNGAFWRFLPGSEFDADHYEFKTKVHIDELGGRATVCTNCNVDINLTPIVFMGDSFTFGIGVRDEETFSSILSPLVSPRRILNLGIPGGTLNSQIDILENRHVELGSPNKYVFVLSIDRFSEMVDDYLNKGRVDSRANLPKSAFFNFYVGINDYVYHNWFLKRIYTLQFVRHFVIQAIWGRKNSFTDPLFPLMNRNDQSYRSRARFALDDEMNRLAALKKRFSFDFVFITIPSVYQIYSEDLTSMAEAYGYSPDILDVTLPNALLSEILERFNFGLIDPTECVAQQKSDRGLYYIQDHHLTPRGHKLFADCVGPGLVKFVKSE